MRLIVREFSLYETIQWESIELCITFHGAEKSKDLSHLTFGVSNRDKRASDPRNGSPLSYCEDGVFAIIQYRLMCRTSMNISIFDNVMAHGLSANKYGLRIMPILMWSPQDLSSLWKCWNNGTGAKKHGDTNWFHLWTCMVKIAYFTLNKNRFVSI
jgi:hypothetical protein